MTASRRLVRLAAVPLAIATLSLAPALAADEATMTNPNDIKWGDAPPNLPKGGKLAVLHGDPSKPGPFVIRLKAPAGYKIPPHTHSQTENLTVVSGTLYLGMSEKADPKSEHALKAGAFHYLPGKTAHYAFTKAPTVVQVHGEGPFDITYLNPADDPSKGK
jgi:quercetin dioxygenase-like cupin family protein